MAGTTKPNVLIIGAGSMGLVTGYHLQTVANITFLVRPHREESLKRPQRLYSYDDKQLNSYTGYSVITSPDKILEAKYQYIVITLDGTALSSPEGLKLCKIIGEAGKQNADLKVILGTVGVDMHTWFVNASNLSPEQVTIGWFGILVYPPNALASPLAIPAGAEGKVDEEKLAQADQAYTTKLGGYVLTDASPTVQQPFAQLWDSVNPSGTNSKCIQQSSTQLMVEGLPFFCVIAALGILDWPHFSEIAASLDRDGDEQVKGTWELAVAAANEIQGLGIHGEVGQAAAKGTTPEVLVKGLTGLEGMIEGVGFDFRGFDR